MESLEARRDLSLRHTWNSLLTSRDVGRLRRSDGAYTTIPAELSPQILMGTGLGIRIRVTEGETEAPKGLMF